MDLRSIRLGIEIDGQMHYYLSDSGFAIHATGTKFATAKKNEISIDIKGLKRETINYLLGNVRPFDRTASKHLVTLDAGRQKAGLQPLFVGDIVGVSPSQPPDNTVTIQGVTGNTASHKIVSTGGKGRVRLSELAQGVASDIGAVLQFEIQDKLIESYTYTGSAWGQVARLSELGQCRAFLDDGVLLVSDYEKPVKSRVRRLTADSGMIGIPTVTEYGLDVSFLIDGHPCEVGGGLIVKSVMNPAANGNYIIAQLGFDVSSHDDAFFYTAKCKAW